MLRISIIKLCLLLVILTMAIFYVEKLFQIHSIPTYSSTVKITDNLDAIYSLQKRKVFPENLPTFPKVSLRLKRWLGEEFLSWKSSFYKTILERADHKKRIYLGLVDASYVDMAYNMYITSFKRFGITNVLFVCADRQAVEDLRRKEIFCYYYEQNMENTNIPAEAGYQEFRVRTAPKMKITWLALLYGFNVIVIDIDVIFLKNPVEYLPFDNIDVAFQQDVGPHGLNVGFGIVLASPASLNLFENVGRLRLSNKISDQLAVNTVLRKMKSEGNIRVKALNIAQFPVGDDYYLNGKREFLGDNVCKECVIIHSSGIRSKAAKIYRFREEAFWKADDETYFNNPNRKYLMYENTKGYIGDSVIDEEEMALKTAFKIGFVLNRIVILPKLNCENNFKCTMLHRYRIEALDDFLRTQYREHVFLENTLVPMQIKSNISPKVYLTPDMENITDNEALPNAFKNPSLRSGFIHSIQIRNWLNNQPWSQYAVLKFDSLYFDVKGIEKNLLERIDKGLCRAGYFQIKRCPRN